MKRLSRLVAAMVALALVLTGVVFAETQGTIAERYQDALSRLERYLMNLQDDSVNITTLAEDFQKLGNYEGSNAFYYYTLGLADASANNYTLIPMYIDALVINTSFDERLTNLRANGVNIPSVAEWAAYLNGRVAESEGNYAEAAEQYQQCLNFMDAQNRILYALAWSRQTSAAATPAPTAAPPHQLRQELPADLQRFGAVLQGHVGKCELQLYLLCCRDDQGRAAAVLE